ncbi:SDR family NAD(P)-dependent oxidoreductase [Streptomyces sp. NPDC102441]|uniref:SDR family NAD(P)-dependent oxidoreductase n=1 Tax=Streptomyces sp. NPDC102441 TaxID=3366176 RepID=UPI0038142FC9
MIGDLQGKVAFITGSAGGIGLGMARAFAEAGMKIAMADVDAEALEQAASDLEASGATVLAVPLDVTDPAGWAAAAEKVQAALGPVQLLCNNAGVSTLGLKFGQITPELWTKVVDTNVNGAFNGIRCFLEPMVAAGGGHIVNTASMGGLFGGIPDLTAYTATKFALVGLSESLRAELAVDGLVGVSVVCPGGVRSRLWRTSLRARGVADADAVPSSAGGQSASPDGMDPYEVGLRTVDAVHNNELYVITHPEFRAAIVYRHDQLMAACDHGEAVGAELHPNPDENGTARLDGTLLVETLTGGNPKPPAL